MSTGYFDKSTPYCYFILHDNYNNLQSWKHSFLPAGVSKKDHLCCICCVFVLEEMTLIVLSIINFYWLFLYLLKDENAGIIMLPKLSTVLETFDSLRYVYTK